MYPGTKVIKKELFPVVDAEGRVKPIIQVIVEEAVESGIEEICLITQPGDDRVFRGYFEGELSPALKEKLDSLDWAREQSRWLADLGRRMTYVEQRSQEGYGHAVYCARDWVGQSPFLLLLGDHLYTSTTETRCARQLLDTFGKCQCSVSAVARTHESQLHLFGTIAGDWLADNPRVVRVTHIREKPDIEYARRNLRVPGLPEYEYLCWFGQHVFTPGIFDALKHQVDRNLRERGEIQLTSAQEWLRETEGVYYAFETRGRRYDTGSPAEYVRTMGGYYHGSRVKGGRSDR
jgi:UTP--glucose-1-phosphate uridylyltransferase